MLSAIDRNHCPPSNGMPVRHHRNTHACAVSFYVHVFFDKEYHVDRSRLQRFAWFRRKQELHFVHHRHADSNFAVIDFFWDRLLGTYRPPDEDSRLRLLTLQAMPPAARMSWSRLHAGVRAALSHF